MAEMEYSGASVLVRLAEEVRRKTLAILERTAERELLWAPPGTSNHILWHAGHALWLQGVLALAPVIGDDELPSGWVESFGMNCRPIDQTTVWPTKAELERLLGVQLERFREVVGGLTAGDLTASGRRTGQRTVGDSILHGLHDEACHQGEMYLLLKMQRYA